LLIQPYAPALRAISHGETFLTPTTKTETTIMETTQDGLKASASQNLIGYLSLAGFYGAADKVPEANAALAEAMKLDPKISVARFLVRGPSYIDSPPGFREGLRKAGLPEQ
jgi:hypothetical protein